MFSSATKKRMRVFCTLTKPDEVDGRLRDNIALIVHHAKIHKLRSAVAMGTGIPIDQVSNNLFCPTASVTFLVLLRLPTFRNAIAFKK